MDSSDKSSRLLAGLIGFFVGIFVTGLVLINGADLIMRTWP
jgi:hypothetical protein